MEKFYSNYQSEMQTLKGWDKEEEAKAQEAINKEEEVCQFCGSDNLERIMNSIICADCRRKVRDMYGEPER